MPSITLRPAAGANSPVDGSVGRAGFNQTFSNIRSGAGNSSGVSLGVDAIVLTASTTTNQFQSLWRVIICFDTSSLPEDAIITSATLRLYGATKEGELGTTSLDVVSASPSSTSNLVDSDYSTLGTTLFGSIPY